MYQDLLKKLGFDDKEVAVFITILEQGRVTPATVAIITGINRSTVYSIAKVLAEKGIITIDTTSEPSYLVVESAQILEQIIHREERQLEEKKKIIQESIQLLENIPKSKHYSVPKVRFYNEKELKDALYERVHFWFKSALEIREYEWWGVEDESWIKIFPDWIIYHWENAPKEIGARFITNDKKLEKTIQEQSFNEQRQVKFIGSEKHNFTANQVVLGDYIVYIMTHEKPYYMIEIHDRVMAHNLRETFKLLWEKI